ncbi:MAG: cell division FtsZ family protein [Mycoplasma sp.]|nr:cell division FtsZ family protein [Candidatus Hennigella equi]
MEDNKPIHEQLTPVDPNTLPQTPKPAVQQPAQQPPQPQKTNHVFSNIDLNQDNQSAFNIKVIGIGGAGCNVINHIAATHPNIVDAATIYALNTDLCSLKLMKNVPNLFLLNKEELKGYGSGCNPEIGKQAVIHDAAAIKAELTGTDMLFIIAGLGKGAGSGGAPELAQIAKELGILTVAIVNMPAVACEGNIIYNNAFNGLQSLIAYADSVSTISNEKIISNNKNISFYDAYHLANEEIADIIEDILNIIFKPSVMNIDFADLKTFFKMNKFFRSNRLMIESSNLNQVRIREAIANRIKNSFSDVNITDCQHAIVNISLSKDTPTTILADINKSFVEITKNEKLTMVTGINYNDEKKIDISYLISGKNYSSNFDNAFEATSGATDKWAEPTIKVEPVVDSGSNEYDNLMKDVEEAARPTEDILAQNKDDKTDIG